MAAVRGEDRISVGQMSADTRRNCLLADVGVACAVDQPALMTAREFFFGLTNDLHRPIESEDLFVREGLVLVHSFLLALCSKRLDGLLFMAWGTAGIHGHIATIHRNDGSRDPL